MDFDTMLTRLPAKDRALVERQLAARSAETQYLALWRRLAAHMYSLASLPPKATAQALQFYVPDGAYRMQVFALHDAGNGLVEVYCENVLKAATASGLLTKGKPAEGGRFYCRIPGAPSGADLLLVDEIDGKTENLPTFCKDLTGWNRRALRITVPVASERHIVDVVESLCTLAARTWVVAPKPA